MFDEGITIFYKAEYGFDKRKLKKKRHYSLKMFKSWWNNWTHYGVPKGYSIWKMHAHELNLFIVIQMTTNNYLCLARILLIFDVHRFIFYKNNCKNVFGEVEKNINFANQLISGLKKAQKGDKKQLLQKFLIFDVYRIIYFRNKGPYSRNLIPQKYLQQ